ncbi:MAG: hypothetical protein RL213_202 [Bacteroidota bacterium]
MRLIISFVLLSLFSSFRPEGFVLVNGLPFSPARTMTIDAIGNIYVVSDNQLLKFDADGRPLQNFSDYRQGELRSVDAGNAMKVVLFYPDMARLVVLGTQFAPQSTIELRNIGIVQPTVVCNSVNNGYWVYDLQDFQLKKIDLNLQPVFFSGNLMQLTGRRVLPNFMLEYDHRVYMNDPSSGILVFDQFGSYLKTISISGLTDFQIVGNELLCMQDNHLIALDLRMLNEREITLPEHGSMKGARINERRYYLLTTDSLNIYSY